MDDLTPLASDPPFLYSDVEPRPGGLPARYTGPLPRTADEEHARTTPPVWYVEDRLRAAEPSMLARLEEALAEVRSWGRWRAPSYARWIARALDTPPVSDWLEVFLARATDDDLRKGLLSAVVMGRRFVLPRGLDEAVQAAWDAAEARLDALVAKHGVDAEAAEAWRERRAPLPPPSPSLLGPWLDDDDDDDDEDFFAPPPLDPRDLADANQAVRLRVGIAKTIVATEPDRIVEVAAALECMATDSTVAAFDRRRALRELAEIAPDAAVPLANGERHAVLEPVAVLLRRFPNVGAVARHLVSLGLLDSADGIAPDDASQWSIARLLYDRVETFESKCDAFPNEHDLRLHLIATRLGRGALADVVFEEVPPRSDDDDEPDEKAPVGAYVLRAYAEGKVWEIRAEVSKHYDVDGMLGLLNIVARHLGRDIRFVRLPYDEPDVCILGAPIDAIERAAKDGVLILCRRRSRPRCRRRIVAIGPRC